MKTRFTTVDLFAMMHEVKTLVGLRVQNVYDIDSKTYLIKFHKPDAKAVILIESGMRIHPTEFDWAKNPHPSSFSMKLRKHIKQKRLVKAEQLGVDRIVDLQFGEEDRACHVIVELYDRGNVVLTDQDYSILNILRPRTDKDKDVRFAVREKYPVELARKAEPLLPYEQLVEILDKAKQGENLRKILTPQFLFGPALLEHCFRLQNFSPNSQLGKNFTVEDFPRVYAALQTANELFLNVRLNKTNGFIITKTEEKAKDAGEGEKLETYQDFHPILFEQCKDERWGLVEFEDFAKAVDDFFSKKESQKLDLKALQQEREALKKLDNIKRDHEQRIKGLKDVQDKGQRQAAVIELNQELVDRAILVIRSALANQHNWTDIQEMLAEAQARRDPVALAIKQLKLEENTISLQLEDPFSHLDDDEDDEEEEPLLVDIDLNMGAYQNACKYYGNRKKAAAKEMKTVDASKKALKSAELKTQETLKQVQIKTSVQKQRKTFWFEKFLWFISSDNHIVVGGRDAQQNELLVKRYLRPGDVYVHADLRGAASVIVKNKVEGEAAPPIPPKTLNEAGAMAVCFSAAWEAKVVAGAWWVYHHQVSKTAPAGEYLTAGSFMIRGKKNYLAAVQLQTGFGLLFRLEEESIERRRQTPALNTQESTETPSEVEEEKEVELDLEESEEEVEDKTEAVDGQENGGDEEEFPDVQLSLKHLNVAPKESQEEYTVLRLGPTRQEPKWKRAQEEEARKEQEMQKQQQAAAEKEDANAKRGQKHKKKKLIKYKDQDEEERQLRMTLLGSAGDKKPKGKKAKGQAAKRAAPPSKPSKPIHEEPEAEAEEDEEVAVEEEEKPEGAVEEEEVKKEEAEEEEEDPNVELRRETDSALDSLNGAPTADDLLIFAVPVCGPYSALARYKFKVKLTPGTGKRGKATKTALQMFLKDKSTTGRERDLFRALQDQDLARNLPGKVKVSAPHLTAVKQQQKKK